MPEFDAPEFGAAELIDAHHHLWHTRVLDYPEFAGDPDLERPFLAGDDNAAAGACGITGSIVVEAATAGAPGADETRWLRREAASSRVVAGVVAWAPVSEPGLDGYLRGLLAAPGPPVVGIRCGFADEPARLAEPGTAAGVRAVGAAGALGSLSHSEMTRILAGTARAVYGLTEPFPAWPAGSTQGKV